MAATPDEALRHIRLLTLVNDVSLRNLIPAELAKGFGFFQSKPATAFSPVAVTPDELGDAWREGRVHLPMIVTGTASKVGQPDCGTDMVFHFGAVDRARGEDAQRARGSIVGSGTVSNKDTKRGYCCIAEKRCLETIEHGAPETEFMKFGDSMKIEMFDEAGQVDFRRNRSERRGAARVDSRDAAQRVSPDAPVVFAALHFAGSLKSTTKTRRRVCEALDSRFIVALITQRRLSHKRRR